MRHLFPPVVGVVAVPCLGGIGIAAFVGATAPATTAPPAAAGTTPTAAPPTTQPSATTATTPPPQALPADRTYSGRGAKVVKLSLSADYVHIATITHQGSGNFAIWSVDAGGEDLDLIVNEIGKYSGVRPLDFSDDPTALKIEANGSWRIVVRVAQKAPAWTGETSGKGAAVLRIDSSALGGGLATVQFTHRGSSNFVVTAWGEEQHLLVNEIGRYTGETLLPSGTVLVEIQADGPWTFKEA
jgi:hypothetical protein